MIKGVGPGFIAANNCTHLRAKHLQFFLCQFNSKINKKLSFHLLHTEITQHIWQISVRLFSGEVFPLPLPVSGHTNRVTLGTHPPLGWLEYKVHRSEVPPPERLRCGGI